MAVLKNLSSSVSTSTRTWLSDLIQKQLWLTVVNFVSAVCGILCIFFTAKASVSNCAFGIVNTVTYKAYLAYRDHELV